MNIWKKDGFLLNDEAVCGIMEGEFLQEKQRYER